MKVNKKVSNTIWNILEGLIVLLGLFVVIALIAGIPKFIKTIISSPIWDITLGEIIISVAGTALFLGFILWSYSIKDKFEDYRRKRRYANEQNKAK